MTNYVNGSYNEISRNIDFKADSSDKGSTLTAECTMAKGEHVSSTLRYRDAYLTAENQRPPLKEDNKNYD